MQSISTTADLKNAIRQLEAEQIAQGLFIKEQLSLAYTRFKPANLIKSNLMEIVSSNKLVYSIIGTGLGLASGYFSKKLVVGTSANIFRRLLGSALQLGISGYSAQHSNDIQSIGQSFFKRLFRKREKNTHTSE